MYDIKKHLSDFSASKWDEFKAQLAPDVVYEEVGTHVRTKGPDDYVKAVQRWKRAFPDLTAHFVRTYSSGDSVIAEVEWEGTHGGPLEGPFGTIAATNKRGMTKAVMVVRLKGDLVVEAHHYFDVLTVLANIGIAPFAAAPAAKSEVASKRPH